jgi:uncharacterized protein YPO0396
MLTLERARLVNWHNFEDHCVEIGNRCLLAGDNGSGKSTAIDALQYALAADLRKAKFNSAAGERKGGGRDLLGYVRCKLGSDSAEYLRGDTVAHIMLEFSLSAPGGKTETFAAGVCVEAYADDRCNEHFWIGEIPVRTISVKRDYGLPMVFRQFKELLNAANAVVYENKKNYIRDLTGRLGVWKRYAEFNPYLEALTRSIGFIPLNSVDKFVCEYILEENLVPVADMKANLESYQDAERQAEAAAKKIAALAEISKKADDWRKSDALVVKHEYLGLRMESDAVAAEKSAVAKKMREAEDALNTARREIASLEQNRFEVEAELKETLRALAANDAHRLYEAVQNRIERIANDLAREEEKVERFSLFKGQCEALLGREIGDSLENESEKIEGEEKRHAEKRDEARRQKEEAAAALADVAGELAELERGILRFPEAPCALRAALESVGIEGHFLAEAAEVADAHSDWTDAVEGWLNTRRFAVLVPPESFQKALEIYDGLPRSVSGALLPNLEKMRGAAVQSGSLAEIVSASGYARIYLDYVLGEVIRADISSLKRYKFAVTKECMSYGSHTASRVKEEIYRRHYLGRHAREERKKFLIAERERLSAEKEAAEKTEREEAALAEACYRVRNTLNEMNYLLPSLAAAESLRMELAKSQAELSGIDQRSFRELEERQKSLEEQKHDVEKKLSGRQIAVGEYQKECEECKNRLSDIEGELAEKEAALAAFGAEHPALLGECESYAEKRIAETGAAELKAGYKSKLQEFTTKRDNRWKEYGALIFNYQQNFNRFFSSTSPDDTAEADEEYRKLETSELPQYREKIAKERRNAEKEFKDHFISRLNEQIENARESFKEINEILSELVFGREQYRFVLEPLAERRGQIEVIRKTAEIPSIEMEDGLFNQLVDPAERKAAEDLFNRILSEKLDSQALRNICDYRTYFHYDIRIKETDKIDEKTGRPAEMSFSKTLREKSGGETQTPYYVAIAASFYRFYKNRPEETLRLVIFDEAFNKMDDERIGKILAFYRGLNLQIITSVPPDKIEAIAPYMDRINIISRYGNAVKIREFGIGNSGEGDHVI